jgi:hypothetical protein
MVADESLLKAQEVYRIIENDELDSLRDFLAGGLDYRGYFGARGEFPLQTAAEHGSIGCLKELLKTEDEQPHAASQGLVEAILENHPEVVRILLDFGVDPGGIEEYEEESDADLPLTAATEHCNPEIFRLLCDAGAVRRTASGWLNETLELLLKTRKRSRDECLAILSANLYEVFPDPGALKLQPALQKSLLRHLKKISAKDKERQAALLDFAEKLRDGLQGEAALRDEVITFIAEGEDDRNIYKILDMICDQPAEIRQRLASASLPYVAGLAESEQCWDLVEDLLKLGADVTTTDEMGGTALMLATHYATVEMLELLIQYGADVNARDQMGHSVLGFSMMSYPEKTEIHQFLRSKGAKTSEELDAEAKKKGR